MNGVAPPDRPRQAHGRYEAWIGGVFQGQVPACRPFLPRPFSYVAVVSIVTWIILIAVQPLDPAIRVPAGVALRATAVAGIVVWVRAWSVAIERIHARLLARTDLGDGRRIVLFFGALVGFGVGSLAIGGLVLWLLAGRPSSS